MNSLRARLILAFSLVAIVPLATAMILMSQRIQQNVERQAGERLDATLGLLRAQMSADSRDIAAKLRILAQDAELRRMFLVGGHGEDLAAYLGEKRFLLGFDDLAVLDESGEAVARGLAGATTADAADTTTAASGLTMSAEAPIRYQGRTVGVVRGGVRLDARRLGELKQMSGVDLVLRDAAGHTITSTLGPELQPFVPLMEDPDGAGLRRRSYLSRNLPIDLGGAAPARIVGLVSTSSADETIVAFRWTALVLGIVGVAVAVLLGALWSLQISRPVERLAGFSQRIAQGEWDEPLALRSVREIEALVAALDQMRADLKSYRGRLVVSERQAAWAQMARKVAHEVKNPLTPIAVSVADLKRSFEAGRLDFPHILDQATRTIAAEIETLKGLLQEFSEFGRLPPPRRGPCRVTDLMNDLRTLYGREVAAGRLHVDAPATDVQLSVDAGQIRQALVNLIKNALEATQGGGDVNVGARTDRAALEITVTDGGPGLNAEQRMNLFVPNFTTKAHGAGLGLTIVEKIVGEHGGTIRVDPASPRGTTFRIRLPMEQGH